MNRRTDKGYKLRTYLEAIKELDAKSNEKWLQEWIDHGQGGPYVSKAIFRAYLETYVVMEASEYFARKAA